MKLTSFDDGSNREVTNSLIRNVLAVSKTQHDFSTIKSKCQDVIVQYFYVPV